MYILMTCCSAYKFVNRKSNCWLLFLFLFCFLALLLSEATCFPKAWLGEVINPSTLVNRNKLIWREVTIFWKNVTQRPRMPTSDDSLLWNSVLDFPVICLDSLMKGRLLSALGGGAQMRKQTRGWSERIILLSRSKSYAQKFAVKSF